MKNFLLSYERAVENCSTQSYDCYEDYIADVRSELDFALTWISEEHHKAEQDKNVASVERSFGSDYINPLDAELPF